MRAAQFISLFFLFCLLNVAFIPQLCLSAVQSLNNDLPTHAQSEDENKDFGIKIFEEESKEGHEENRTGAENLLKIIKGNSPSNLSCFIHSSYSEMFFNRYLNDYGSVNLTPLSPPPDKI